MGKSTTAVNLAYTLAQMGAKVGILDGDVYGPSLPTMVKPDPPVLRMDAETRAILPPEFEDVKVVSLGFHGTFAFPVRHLACFSSVSVLLHFMQHCFILLHFSCAAVCLV